MTVQMVLDLAQRTITIALLLSAPILATAIVVGVLINIIQTITQIKDMSLTFVPKAGIAAAVLMITLPWSLNVQISFCREILQMLPGMGP